MERNWIKQTRSIATIVSCLIYSVSAQVSTNNAVISDGQFVGLEGGWNWDVLFGGQVENDENGLTISGNNIINGGEFVGGPGANFNPYAVEEGGSGIFIQNGTNQILGGVFSGSAPYSDNYDQGYGVNQFVASQESADLSLLGGVINSGLNFNVEVGGSASLDISQNIILEGNLTKHGQGILILEGDISQTVQQLDIIEGEVQSGSLTVNGVINGTDISQLNVNGDLSLFGALNNLNVVFSGVTNRMNVGDGAYFNSTFYATNSSYDTLAFAQSKIASEDSLDVGQIFVGFERIELADDVVDTWELTELDAARTDYVVDGGDGNVDDILAWKVSGVFSNQVFDGPNIYNTGFEKYGLSDYNDIWLVASNDNSLGNINARDGVDLLDIENYEVDLNEIGLGKLYESFEGVLLSSQSSEWDAFKYGDNLYIDAFRNTNIVLSYQNTNDSVVANISEIGASSRYRNFHNVVLSDNNDFWQLSALDSILLDSIDGSDGIDTIEALSEGILLNSANIGESSSHLYRGFENIILSGNNDTWFVTAGDFELDNIDAGEGIDRLEGTLTSSANIGESSSYLYRGFEEVKLTNNKDIWSITSNDIKLNWIDASGSMNDTLRGSLNNSLNMGSDLIYRNFEIIELDPNAFWTITENDLDENLEVRASTSSGGDTLHINTDQEISAEFFNDYSSFEILRVSDGVFDLQDQSLLWNGTYRQLGDATLSLYATTNGLSSNPRLVADDIEMLEGTTIRIEKEEGASIIQYAFNNRYTNQILQAANNFTWNEQLINTEAGTYFDVKKWYITDNGLFAIFDRRSLTDSTNGIAVASGSQLDKILSEIDSMNTDSAARMVDIVFSPTVNPNSEDLNKVYGRSVALPRAISHLRNGVFRSINDRTAERRMMMNYQSNPKGVSGVNGVSQGISTWIKGYAANGTASQNGLFEGYDLTGVGSMIGTDILYNEWLFGVAAGIYNQTMEMDLSGEYSGAASHISGFMSYGDEGWILEGSVSIANSALDFESDGIFELDAEYEASDTSIYLGTGYVMKDEKSAWIPEVGVLISSYSQDEVMDNTEAAVPVELKEFSQSSMQMRLGISGVFRRGFIGRELLSQLKVRWMNHISVLDDEVDFSLTDGSEIYQMPLLTPSKSLLEVGLSAQLRMNRSLSLLMGFDLESGGGYSANRLNAGLRYNF